MLKMQIARKIKKALIITTACITGCGTTTDPLALFEDIKDDPIISLNNVPVQIANDEEYLGAIKDITPTVLDLKKQELEDLEPVEIKYQPLGNKGYVAKGTATLSGQADGARTSNGEIYEKNGYMASHSGLPLPCIVEVTNLNNNKRVIVRVNNRNEQTSPDKIVLSKKAAEKIGINQATKVKIKQLSNQLPSDEPGYNRYIQVGAFVKKEQALKLIKQFMQDETKFKLITEDSNRSKLYKVLVGPIKDIDIDTLRTIKRKYANIIVGLKG